MVWRKFIIFIGLTTALADDTLHRFDMDALKALLPLLGDPPPPQPQQQPLQNVFQQNNEQKNTYNAKLENILQQIKPPSYNPYDTAVNNNNNNNNAPDRCANSYYSVETLLPLLSIFLEILDQSKQSNKAQTVIALLKKYLDLAPPSIEKNKFLEKLRNVEEHLVINAESTGDSAFQSAHPHKTTIVFDKELPGVDQQNCRETFGRLIQTAVNVYKETAKYPQCQPTGVIDENLYYPSNYVKPQKPYQFLVVYEKPVTSYYTPDYSGLSILPNLNVQNSPYTDNLIPNLVINKQPYQVTSGLNPTHPVQVQPDNVVPQYDILSLIKQHKQLHPESPKNDKFYLELFSNLTGRPNVNNPTNQYLINNPLQELNLNNLDPNSLQSVQSPVIPVANYPRVLSLGSLPFPGSNNVEQPNHLGPLSINDLTVPQHPQNNGISPGAALFVKPMDHIYGQHNPNPPNAILNQVKVNSPQNPPELTLEILLSLLGNPDGSKTQIQVTPELLRQLVQYLRPNSPERKLLELHSPNLFSNDGQNLVPYGADGATPQQSLLELLGQQPGSQPALLPGNSQADNDALINKLQQWLGVSNNNKLPALQNNPNVIELTYVLKRPKPLIYRPIYYVKYRLPYQTFVQNFYNLIMKKQDVRSDLGRLYQDLITVSNISDVSPSLKKLEKEEILKLVFGNGTLIDARVVDVPDSVLNDELEETRKMNAEVDLKVIEELNDNLGVLNKTQTDSYLDDPAHWLPPPQQATPKVVEDLDVKEMTTPTTSNTPAKLSEVKASSSNDGSSAHPNHELNHQVIGLPTVPPTPSHPLKVKPAISYSKPQNPPIKNKFSGIPSDRSSNKTYNLYKN